MSWESHHIILSLPCGAKETESGRVKRYSEIIADNLGKAGWNWGCVSAVDSRGRTIFGVDVTATTESVSLCMRMTS